MARLAISISLSLLFVTFLWIMSGDDNSVERKTQIRKLDKGRESPTIGSILTTAEVHNNDEIATKYVEGQQTASRGLQYVSHLFWLPNRTSASSRIPLIVFLHGAGESGSDPTMIVSMGSTGTPPHLNVGPIESYALLSPQTGIGWCVPETLAKVVALIEHLLTKFQTVLDPDRVAVTGVSMGGAGALCLATYKPSLFSACVPVCGYSHDAVHHAEVLSKSRLPIWLAHGVNDVVVTVDASDEIYRACLLSKCNVVNYNRYAEAETPTGYPESVGHAAWKNLYSNNTFWDWL
eukprot:PhF_6_TR35127/c0_g1_i3/m.51209